MIQNYYISPTRINSLISETVIPGSHIVVEGLTYELVSRRPKNKIVKRTLSNDKERIILF